MDGGVTFDVKNLEVWGFTLANTVADAQKSEMSMHFARESISSSLTSFSSRGTDRNSFGGRRSPTVRGGRFKPRSLLLSLGRDDEKEVDRTCG